ncbi:hypothetical protein HYV81_00255 [Candidatus Woesearchaeota archaeon]|nr:hypothetical protein [Candidatus Woesearchaeota archaeon]
MAERRDRITIIYDILSAIAAKSGRIKPTHLLYKSNLSHISMKKYIEELKGKKLIDEEHVKEHLFYKLTDEGIKFLNDYKKIREFTESFGL